MMKKINEILLSALILGGVVFAQSCTKQPEALPEPNFPDDVIEKVVLPGEEVPFTISPNQEWRVELVGEDAGNFFWIDDEGFNEVSISGKADENIEFSVFVTSEEDFKEKSICKVICHMGTQQKQIAELTLFGKERQVICKAALLNKDNTRFTEDYEDIDEKNPNIKLVAFHAELDYTRPVSLCANYDWNLLIPDFCEIYVDSKRVDGPIEVKANEPFNFTLKAKANAEILSGAVGKLTVRDVEFPDQISSFDVLFPDSSKRVDLIPADDNSFNADGLLDMGGISGLRPNPAVARVVSTKDVLIKSLAVENGKYTGKTVDWVLFQADWDEEGDFMQYHQLFMNVETYYEVGERTADVLIIPASMDQADPKDFLSAETGSLKEEYQPYLLNRIHQDGLLQTFVYSDKTAEELAGYGAYFTQDNSFWPVKKYNAKQGFKLKYDREYVGESLYFRLDEVVDHYEIIAYPQDENLPEYKVDNSDLNNFWLTFVTFGRDKKRTRIRMFPKKSGNLKTEAVLLLYTKGEDRPTAAVHCTYVPEPTPSHE